MIYIHIYYIHNYIYVYMNMNIILLHTYIYMYVRVSSCDVFFLLRAAALLHMMDSHRSYQTTYDLMKCSEVKIYIFNWPYENEGDRQTKKRFHRIILYNNVI